MRLSRRIGRAARLAIGLAILSLVISRLSAEALVDRLAGLAWSLVLAATGIELAIRVLSSLKWHFLLRFRDPGSLFKDALAAHFVGVAVGSLLPSGGVDLAVGYAYYRQSGRAATAAASVAVDRLLSIVALLVFATLMTLLHLETLAVYREIGMVAAGAILLPLAVAAVFRWIPARWASRLQPVLDEFRNYKTRGMQVVGKNFAISMVIQILRVGFVFVLLYAVGESLPLALCAIIAPILFLFIMVPMGWLGWEQGVFVVILGLAGVQAEAAFAAAVVNRLVVALTSIPGVVFVVTGWGMKARAGGQAS
jgi:uncharacterized membrane protein YbhN (UPF0104 family)